MKAIGRAFVAVVPPERVLDAIEARVASLRSADGELGWSRRGQWHLTLRFLGPVPDVDGLVVAMRETLASAPCLRVRLAGAGAFPDARRASVVWLGLGDGADGLAEVTAAVESASAVAGFAPESRPFVPHLTVARLPKPRDVGPILDPLGHEPVGDGWSVDDVVLLASETRPSGAVYTEVARIPLA